MAGVTVDGVGLSIRTICTYSTPTREPKAFCCLCVAFYVSNALQKERLKVVLCVA